MIETTVCDACKAAGKTDPSKCDQCIEFHQKYAVAMGKPDPIQTYEVSCTYYATGSSTIHLPLYKTWEDVEEWYVKWGELHFRLKGETEWGRHSLAEDISIGDQKTPVGVTIHSEDYAEEIASK